MSSAADAVAEALTVVSFVVALVKEEQDRRSVSVCCSPLNIDEFPLKFELVILMDMVGVGVEGIMSNGRFWLEKDDDEEEQAVPKARALRSFGFRH